MRVWPRRRPVSVARCPRYESRRSSGPQVFEIECQALQKLNVAAPSLINSCMAPEPVMITPSMKSASV